LVKIRRGILVNIKLSKDLKDIVKDVMSIRKYLKIQILSGVWIVVKDSRVRPRNVILVERKGS
tara:strand:- start:6 stop:194 length:189 start_codon:yes stop_codon:yes gene_type:complete